MFLMYSLNCFSSSPLFCCVGLFLFNHTWSSNPISNYDYQRLCLPVLDTDWYFILGFVLECDMSWIMTYKMRIKVDATFGAMCVNICDPPYLTLLSLIFLGPSECGMDVIKTVVCSLWRTLTDHCCQWKKTPDWPEILTWTVINLAWISFIVDP